jgi:hypothetical protein
MSAAKVRRKLTRIQRERHRDRVIGDLATFTKADIEAMRGKPKLSTRITDYAGTKKHAGYTKFSIGAIFRAGKTKTPGL